MSQENLQLYRSTQAAKSERFRRDLRKPFAFRGFVLAKIPMAFLAGIRIGHIDADSASFTVPFRWLNQNPFRSTYFAVLGMAAELPTGMLAQSFVVESTPRVSLIITGVEATFARKATGLTTFACRDGAKLHAAVEQAILSGEAQTVDALSVGTSQSGEIESEFRFTWSFKAKA